MTLLPTQKIAVENGIAILAARPHPPTTSEQWQQAASDLWFNHGGASKAFKTWKAYGLAVRDQIEDDNARPVVK